MIKIIADSTCDLDDEIIEKYNIGIVSLYIVINGKSYRERIDMKPDEFHSIVGDLKENPTTSMPSPTDYLKVINKSIENGHKEILCICMSSGTSGSYQSAAIAKDYFYEKNSGTDVRIHIIDSQSMSHGSGWLVLKSAKLREAGATFDQLVEFNETYKTNVKHFLCVDDLSHLMRSGRLSNTSALIGKVLNVKPIMTMKKGKGAIVAKERGMKRALKHYVTEFMKRNDETISDFIIVGYTSVKSIAEDLMDKLIKETKYTGDIFIMQMGLTVGNHVGPGAVSMFFVETGDKKDGLLINELNLLVEKKNQLVEKIMHKTK